MFVTKEYSDYLAHYGVKGQKWGVRRYQNEDGTLTSAGRQRYDRAIRDLDKVLDRANKDSHFRKIYSDRDLKNLRDYRDKLAKRASKKMTDGGMPRAESDTWKKSEAKNLSDEELNRRNNRLQREFQYKQNLSNRHPVRKEAASIANKVLLGSAIGIATAAMTKNYKKVLEIGSKYLGTAAGRKVLKTKVASIAAASVIRTKSLRRLK